jgi:hypothetical protein
MLSEPWFRTSDGWWYAYVRENGGRRQIRLVKGEDRRTKPGIGGPSSANR